MRKPIENINLFIARRKQLAGKISGSAVILASNPEHLRNHDVGFAYRQDSNFYYLTGFEEPEAIFIFRPGLVPETVMFVRRKDVERETWDGFRYGPEATEVIFKIDKCYPIDEFHTVAPQLLKEVSSVYYRLIKNPEADQKVLSVLDKTRASQGRTGIGLLPILDSDSLIGEMRLFKSPEEMHNLRRACEISAFGHLESMKFCKPGVFERQIQGLLSYHFYNEGAAREGYNYIVASGNNATTLHYNFNDQVCKDGELLLIDAGAEYNYFTGDITRTFPVNGKFTEHQAKLYQGVLDVQKKLIESIKPGIFFKDLHELGASMLTDLMLELGFFTGRKEDIIASNQHRKYYPHGIGHWLGMDVHDSGLYYLDKEPRALEAGMCFTIEPGIYIPQGDQQAPAEYRGMGIRIEDNICVTSTGHENMTHGVPKEIYDIEQVMKK